VREECIGIQSFDACFIIVALLLPSWGRQLCLSKGFDVKENG